MYKISKILAFSLIFAVLIMLQSQDSLGQNTDNSEAISNEGIGLFNAGKFTDAEKKFNSALKASKFNKDAYYYLALIYSIYAEKSIDAEDEKMQMIEKACEYLKNAVSAGFREYRLIILDARFEVIREASEYEKIIDSLEYLLFKESSWAETRAYEFKVTFPEKIDLEKKYPLLVYLKNKDKDEAEKFTPEKLPETQKMACAVLQYSVGEVDVHGGSWSEYTEKRVRKTLEEIKEKHEQRMSVDYSKVYVCGVRQSGYRALMTYLKYSDVFAGAICFNAPMYNDSEVYKLLDSHENKASLRIIAVQSKKDTLLFKKNDESWTSLKKSGVLVDYRVEEDFIFDKVMQKYGKFIYEFIDKELPKPEKTDEGLQTRESKPDENSDETEEAPEEPDNSETPETPETPKTPAEPEKDNTNE